MSDGDNGDQWDCSFCISKQLQQGRNCDGESDPAPVVAKVFDLVFTRCPLRELDQDAAEIVNFISSCDGGGMAVSRILVSDMLNETAWYFTYRSIIYAERHRIDKKKDKDKKKDGS